MYTAIMTQATDKLCTKKGIQGLVKKTQRYWRTEQSIKTNKVNKHVRRKLFMNIQVKLRICINNSNSKKSINTKMYEACPESKDTKGLNMYFFKITLFNRAF